MTLDAPKIRRYTYSTLGPVVKNVTKYFVANFVAFLARMLRILRNSLIKNATKLATKFRNIFYNRPQVSKANLGPSNKRTRSGRGTMRTLHVNDLFARIPSLSLVRASDRPANLATRGAGGEARGGGGGDSICK